MPELVVLNGVAAGTVFALGDVPAVVGRSPEAHLQICDPWISGMHAMFERRGDALWVVDLESRNGTYIGEQRVGEAAIPEGGVVRLGRTEVRVSMASSSPARRSAAALRRGEGDRPGPTLSTRVPLAREPEEGARALAPRAATVLRMAVDAPALEEVAAAPARYRAAFEAAVRAATDAGGAVTRLGGVGVLAVFGLEHHEPADPSRALSAARAARHAVRAEGGLELRAAVDAGPVLAGSAAAPAGLEAGALGPAADRTERLLALAAPGEILAGPGAAGAEGLTRVGLVRLGQLEIEVFRDGPA